jgi:hypothetical protein
MAGRRHIIYAHPAGEDGYAFFYLCHLPGHRQLSLRCRPIDAEEKEVSLAPAAMLDLVENQAGLRRADAAQLRPWDRAAKALRIRIKTWADEAGGAAQGGATFSGRRGSQRPSARP